MIVLKLMMILLPMPVTYYRMRCNIERSPFDLGSAGQAKVHAGTPLGTAFLLIYTYTRSFGTGPCKKAEPRWNRDGAK